MDPTPDIRKYEYCDVSKKDLTIANDYPEIEFASSNTSHLKVHGGTCTEILPNKIKQWHCPENDNFQITVNGSNNIFMKATISVSVDINHRLKAGVGSVLDGICGKKSDLSEWTHSNEMGEYYSQGSFNLQKEQPHNNSSVTTLLHLKTDRCKINSPQQSPIKNKVLSPMNSVSPKKRRKRFSPQNNKILKYLVHKDDANTSNKRENKFCHSASSVAGNMKCGDSQKCSMYNRSYSNGNNLEHCCEKNVFPEIIIISSDEDSDPSGNRQKESKCERVNRHIDFVEVIDCDDEYSVENKHSESVWGENIRSKSSTNKLVSPNNICSNLIDLSSDQEIEVPFSCMQRIVDLTCDDGCDLEDAGGVIVPDAKELKSLKDEINDFDDNCMNKISSTPQTISRKKKKNCILNSDTSESDEILPHCTEKTSISPPRRKKRVKTNITLSKGSLSEAHSHRGVKPDLNKLCSKIHGAFIDLEASTVSATSTVEVDREIQLDEDSKENHPYECTKTGHEGDILKEENDSSVCPTAVRVCRVQAEVHLSKIYEPWLDLGSGYVSQCCMIGPTKCSALHGKKDDRCKEGEGCDDCVVLKMESGSEVSAFLDFRIDCSHYPSANQIQFMLVHCMNWEEGIAIAIEWLKVLLKTHPPCAYGMLDYYKRILFSPIEEMEISDGPFWWCMMKIEEVMNTIDENREVGVADESSVSSEDENPMSAIDEFIETGIISTRKEERKINYHAKLSNLFAVLDYMVSIMEADLHMGLLKNLTNLKQYTYKSSRPLIAIALWGAHANVGTASVKCRQLMQMYLRICCDHVQHHCTFLHVISLIAGVTYASERNVEPPMYPNLDHNCKEFASTFVSVLLSAAYDMYTVCKILRFLKPEWFKVCVISNLVEKLYGRKLNLNLQSYVDLLQELSALNQQFPSREELSNTFLADPHTNNQSNETEELSPDFVRYARKKDPKGETPLHIQCRRNNVNRVEKLLKVPDININERDHAGWTPLHEAACHGRIECVRRLLNFQTPSGSRAVDLRAKTNFGITPIMDAVSQNHVQVTIDLLQYGGLELLSDKTIHGQSALDFARTEEMINLLTNPPERIEQNDMAAISRTLYIKLAVLIPLAVRFHLQYSGVVKMAHYLRNNTELKREGASFFKFQPLKFKQDYLQYVKLTSLVKDGLNRDNKLLKSLQSIL